MNPSNQLTIERKILVRAVLDMFLCVESAHLRTLMRQCYVCMCIPTSRTRMYTCVYAYVHTHTYTCKYVFMYV